MSKSGYSTNKFGKVFLAGWLVWAGLHFFVFYSIGFSFRVSITDSLVNNIITAGGCLMVSYVMKFYLPQKERYWYIIAISVFLSIFLMFISKSILLNINAGNTSYINLLNKILPVRFGIGFLLIALTSTISLSWYSFLDQKEKEQRQADIEKLTREAELFKLRQQLQPHFLFNSLNSISALAGTKPEEARRMIQQLSDFLRGTIKKEEHQFVTLAEELQHLQLYLEIEKVRFGHRLETIIEADEQTLQLKLPSLLLQPIVENAIKFGLYDTIETVTITVSAQKQIDLLIVEVKNPFDSQTSSVQKGAGFGLSSVKRRLHLLFARMDLLSTETKENIFITTLKIPQVK